MNAAESDAVALLGCFDGQAWSKLNGDFQRRTRVVSSTFIFGWTRKGVLYESDNNGAMLGLDFGYSQSKWVAEQLVRRAGQAGLAVTVYRPSLISVARSLYGDTHDVAARVLAFMIRYGIAVDTPADDRQCDAPNGSAAGATVWGSAPCGLWTV